MTISSGVGLRMAAGLGGLLAVLAVAPASAIVGGREGGALEASAVMVLHDRGGVCSGVVLAEDVVLTAAHCVPPGAQIRVHYRERGRPVLLEPNGVMRHPEYRANAITERVRSIDLALVRTSEPLPARFVPAQLGAGLMAASDAVEVGGFGVAREGDPASTGTWRSALLSVVTPFGDSRVLLWARGASGSGACQGDSGGPVSAGGVVVAVTSWSEGRAGRRCGDLTQAALIGPQRGWIDRTLARWNRQASWR